MRTRGVGGFGRVHGRFLLYLVGGGELVACADLPAKRGSAGSRKAVICSTFCRIGSLLACTRSHQGRTRLDVTAIRATLSREDANWPSRRALRYGELGSSCVISQV